MPAPANATFNGFDRLSDAASASVPKAEETTRIAREHARSVGGVRKPSRQWRHQICVARAPRHVDKRPIRSPDAMVHTERFQQLVEERVQIVEAFEHVRDAEQRRKLHRRISLATQGENGLKPRVASSDGDVAHSEM